MTLRWFLPASPVPERYSAVSLKTQKTRGSPDGQGPSAAAIKGSETSIPNFAIGSECGVGCLCATHVMPTGARTMEKSKKKGGMRKCVFCTAEPSRPCPML